MSLHHWLEHHQVENPELTETKNDSLYNNKKSWMCRYHTISGLKDIIIVWLGTHSEKLH